jgi:hypothetical protein
LPPGKIAIMLMSVRFYRAILHHADFSAGLGARLYVSQDGRRYSSPKKNALRKWGGIVF